MEQFFALVSGLFMTLSSFFGSIFGFGAPPSAALPASLALTSATAVPEAATSTQGARAVSAPAVRPNAPLPQTVTPPSRPRSADTDPFSGIPKTPGCMLRFAVIPSARSVPEGGEFSYAVIAANTGTEPCMNASFSAYYSPNESFVSASEEPHSGDYYWHMGDLASGAEFRTKIVMRVEANEDPRQVRSEACATADNAGDACVQNLVTIGTGGSAPTTRLAAVPASVSGKEAGMWVWDSPLQLDDARKDRAVAAAKQYGFNALYVTVDDYLSIAALPDGAEKRAKREAYFDALASLVRKARAEGIAVDAEAGWRDWAEPPNRWKGYAVIEFVQAYNAARPDARVRGLQFDVEPYLLPRYERDKAAVLSEFAAFIDESAARMRGTDAEFSIVIPYFYTATKQWTPHLSFRGKSMHAYPALLSALEQKPGSTVIIMAYRNFFSGDDGTEEAAKPNILEAAAGKYSAKVVVAQETGDVEPGYVTFHGLSKGDLFGALAEIDGAFRSYPNFGGIAVDYLDPFLALE